VYWVLVGLAAAVARSARWGSRYLGAQLAEGHQRLEEEARHVFQDLEAIDVLQHNQQVAVRHHEGRGEHGVAPAVTHHPQHARPDEEDERQPGDVGDAPRLQVHAHAPLNTTSAMLPLCDTW